MKNIAEYYYEESKKRKLKDFEELFVSLDAEYSYHYARHVLREPFPKGEDAIARDTRFAYFYAKDIIKGPWLKGEEAIAKDPEASYYYAKNVLKLSEEEARIWWYKNRRS